MDTQRQTMPYFNNKLKLVAGQFAELTVHYRHNHKGERIVTHRQLAVYQPDRTLIFSRPLAEVLSLWEYEADIREKLQLVINELDKQGNSPATRKNISRADILRYLEAQEQGDFAPLQQTKLYRQYGYSYCRLVEATAAAKEAWENA